MQPPQPAATEVWRRCVLVKGFCFPQSDSSQTASRAAPTPTSWRGAPVPVPRGGTSTDVLLGCEGERRESSSAAGRAPAGPFHQLAMSSFTAATTHERRKQTENSSTLTSTPQKTQSPYFRAGISKRRYTIVNLTKENFTEQYVSSA